MNPDLKRLCRAAAGECASVAFAHDGSPSIFPEDWEKVVRAVLMALREPQDAYMDACEKQDLEVACGYENVGVSPVVNEVLAAIVDHILAEPATA